MIADVLPGLESGRRTERTEWGLKCPADGELGPAHVNLAASREHAEAMAEAMNALPVGPGYVAVSRQIVTYSTRWKSETSAEGAETP